MTYPQTLIVSEKLTLRRLYHRKLQDVECEIHSANSISQALTILAMQRIDVVLLIEPITQFELSLFLDLLQKRPGWNDIQLIAVGYEHIRHIFPKETIFPNSIEETVRKLSDFISTLE